MIAVVVGSSVQAESFVNYVAPVYVSAAPSYKQDVTTHMDDTSIVNSPWLKKLYDADCTYTAGISVSLGVIGWVIPATSVSMLEWCEEYQTLRFKEMIKKLPLNK